MTYKLLDKVDSPKDIKNFSMEQLKELCAEIRHYMIECCAVNPGHLGSSLGAVELMVGMHYVYDTPEDKLVFDVGHQAYAHKIITGRREAFRKNRMKDGISGFPKRSESEYDAFGVGHSSTSISAALGFAEAARQQGLGNKVVALIGDGSLTGGQAFEGMNNAGASKADMLVILNDNNISIDKNIGGLHEYLLKITTNPKYNSAKSRVWNGLGDGWLRNTLQKFVSTTKSYLVSGSGGDLFQAMGFRYFGPIDGNDIAQVVDTLRKLRNIKGPLLLHVMTTKGKGYAPAEENQTVWHAPGIFDPETGMRQKSKKGESRYQDVFGEVLLELARSNDKIVGITPAMASGCGMNVLAREMPGRFYDVGIEEEHAVTFAAGLAAGGMKPFCNIYSSFSHRAFDQIFHDVALQRLPVALCYDMAIYRTLPGTVIAVPRDETELKNMMYTASLAQEGPFIIRYPRGYGEGADWKNADFEVMEPGRGETLLKGSDVAVIAAGPFANRALEAALKIKEEKGWNPSIYNIRYIKPLDEALVLDAAKSHKVIITVEDGCVKGGLYGAVTELIASDPVPVVPVGIPDQYLSQGTQEELREECGLTEGAIYRIIMVENEKICKKDQKVLEI